MTHDKKAPFKTYSNFLFLRCECLPAKYKSKCQRLTVINMGDGTFEIDGAVLKEKSVDRLLKFLLRAKVAKMTIKKHRHIAGNSGKCIICSK